MTDAQWQQSLPCVPDEGRALHATSAVWRRGRLFASDGDVIRVIDPAERKLFRIAGGGSDPNVAEGPAKLACFRGVGGLAIDDAGLWFCDTGNGAVRRLRFASDSVSTLIDGLPGPVELARDEATLYVACRQGELFEIDTTTDTRRPLETIRDGAITGLAIIARTLYVATASGWLLGIDREGRKVTQRIQLEGAPYSIVMPRTSPWLYVALPGRIQRVGLPDGDIEEVTTGVTEPRALAVVIVYVESWSSFTMDGLYFCDGGQLRWLKVPADTVTSAWP